MSGELSRILILVTELLQKNFQLPKQTHSYYLRFGNSIIPHLKSHILHYKKSFKKFY